MLALDFGVTVAFEPDAVVAGAPLLSEFDEELPLEHPTATDARSSSPKIVAEVRRFIPVVFQKVEPRCTDVFANRGER